MNKFKEYELCEGQHRSPLIIEGVLNKLDLEEFSIDNLTYINNKLLQYGALLFRGFKVENVNDFDKFVGGITAKRFDYIYRSTPRKTLGNGILTSTEYPANQEIPLHNENAYQKDWPLKLAFCCLQPSAFGGETPIADMRRVTAAIGKELVDKFERRGVRYVRHYRPFIDIPWQVVFQTENKSEVEKFCAVQNIGHEWLDNDTLRTTQICQGTAIHPTLNEKVFFIQAHIFHTSSHGEKAEQALIAMFGHDRLPRQSYFGDGEAIPMEDLQAVRLAFKSSEISFPWQAGDVLLVDNMQYAHGRRTFKGDRKVIVSMMESYSGK